jgi:HEAT repeat protein
MLAAKYAGGNVPLPPAIGFPEYLRRSGAYQDVWRQDLIEWELDGQPTAVLARLVVDRTDHLRFSRLALRALLLASAPGFSLENTAAASELAVALGRIQVYEVLRPMEKLFEGTRSSEVRAAVMSGVAQVYCRRSFGLVRQGLQDPSVAVREEALRALRGLRFRDGLDALVRIFRDSSDEAVRIAAIETIADIGSLEAGMVVLEAVLHETGAVQAAAEARLRVFSGDDILPLLRHAVDVEGGQGQGQGDGASAVRRAMVALSARA